MKKIVSVSLIVIMIISMIPISGIVSALSEITRGTATIETCSNSKVGVNHLTSHYRYHNTHQDK